VATQLWVVKLLPDGEQEEKGSRHNMSQEASHVGDCLRRNFNSEIFFEKKTVFLIYNFSLLLLKR